MVFTGTNHNCATGGAEYFMHDKIKYFLGVIAFVTVSLGICMILDKKQSLVYNDDNIIILHNSNDNIRVCNSNDYNVVITIGDDYHSIAPTNGKYVYVGFLQDEFPVKVGVNADIIYLPMILGGPEYN